MSEISDILLALTSKQSWYSEVFDESIVEKWREETYRTLELHHSAFTSFSGVMRGSAPSLAIVWKDLDLFLLAIRILRTTAQGVYHSPTCEWTPYHCHECNLEFLEEEKDNYKEYGYDTYEEFSSLLSLDSHRDPCFTNLDSECEHERCSYVSPNSLLPANTTAKRRV